MNNLRWREPWGGRMLPEDTGLCNRIFHWEIAYGISKANDFKFNILVEKDFWPELQYLEIPHTSWVDSETLRNKKGYTVPAKFYMNHNPITFDKMREMSETKNYKLDTNKDWYPDFGFNFIDEFSRFVDETPELIDRPAQLIKIKDKVVEKYIKQYTQNVVGIHIRRWPTGVYRDEDDVKGFRDGEPIDWELDEAELLKPSGISIHTSLEQTLEERRNELNGRIDKDGKFKLQYTGDPIGYTAINNSAYMYIMDEMLRTNSNQKFYLSTDVPKENLQVFYDKYDIVDYDTITNTTPVMKRYLKNNKDIVSSTGFHRYCFKNIVDLFSLINCSFLIKFGQSTWSTFAEDYNKIPSIYPHNKFRLRDRKKYIRMCKKVGING